MHIEIDKLDAELFLLLYTSVGWEPPCKEQVEKALENTIATFVAYDKEKIILRSILRYQLIWSGPTE